MYKAFQRWCERLLRIPADPEPPPGDESTARIFTAAPNFFRYLLVTWALGTLIPLVILTIVLAGPVTIAVTQMHRRGHNASVLLFLIPGVVITLVVIQRLFSLAILRLDFDKRWYVVTDRSLRIREGVLNVREMTITFANIQNISVSQGPIQRMLGIADLQVETAGGGGGGPGEQKGMAENLHTGWFRGIDNANEVRDLIQARIKHLKDAGLGDKEDVSAPVRVGSVSSSPDFLAALNEVHAEAQKLAQALAAH